MTVVAANTKIVLEGCEGLSRLEPHEPIYDFLDSVCMADEQLKREILKEIGRLSKELALPIHSEDLAHLSNDVDMLQFLISMKDEGLIGGEVVRIGYDRIAHRMTNIRLTYNGLKVLQSLVPPFTRTRT